MSQDVTCMWEGSGGLAQNDGSGLGGELSGTGFYPRRDLVGLSRNKQLILHCC